MSEFARFSAATVGAALVLATLVLASCSSSGGGSSHTSGRSSGSAAPTACADITRINKANAEFDGVGQDLAKGKSLVGPLLSAAGTLAADAPAALAVPAKTFHRSVGTLQRAVDGATSIDALHADAAADTALRAALTDLASSAKQIAVWQKKHC